MVVVWRAFEILVGVLHVVCRVDYSAFPICSLDRRPYKECAYAILEIYERARPFAEIKFVSFGENNR